MKKLVVNLLPNLVVTRNDLKMCRVGCKTLLDQPRCHRNKESLLLYSILALNTLIVYEKEKLKWKKKKKLKHHASLMLCLPIFCVWIYLQHVDCILLMLWWFGRLMKRCLIMSASDPASNFVLEDWLGWAGNQPAELLRSFIIALSTGSSLSLWILST